MKTPEDEAFDEIAKRQGGFRAKRAMAAAEYEWLTGCPTCGMDAGCDCDTAASVLGDQAKYGTSWSKDGERIDPMSVYKEPEQLTEKEKISREMTAEIVAARALAQPAQEPVAWAVYDILHGGSKTLHWPEQHSPNGDPKQYKAVPLYITPPQREPLTDEAVLDIADYCLCDGGKTYGVLDFARAIEAAHGIKE